MAGEWEILPLGELTQNFDSIRVPVKGTDRKSGPYPYYGASGIVDYVNDYLFDGEYLLIAEDGENLRTRKTPVAFIASGKIWVNNHAHIVQGNARATTKFLSYALSQTDISGYLSGSTMPKLTQGNMNRIPVVAPPLPIQKRIAHILGTLDDKIELNRRTNATLEAMARALFRSWFVDFDPVRAKADGHEPTGLDPATAALFPDSFQDSELGPIPEGWEACRWESLTDLHYGKDLDGYKDGVGRYPVFGTNGEIGRSDQVLSEGEGIVIGRKGADRGVHHSAEPFWVIGTAFYMSKLKQFDWKWAYYALKHFDINTIDSGSAIPSTSKPDFMSIPVVEPPIEIQVAFGAFVSMLFQIMQGNLAQSRTLAALRDALLPRLLTGELSVAGSERQVGLDL